jgi:hypothetical protein
MFIELLIPAISGVILSLLAELFNKFIGRKKKEHAKESRELKLQRLTESLREATSLAGQLENEISERAQLADNLQSEIDKYSKLASIKKSEAEALIGVLRSELRSGSRRSFWQGFAINFLFFILGVGITLMVK